MLSQPPFHVLLGVIVLVVGDHHADPSGPAVSYSSYNTYYPDYSYAFNNSVSENPGKRRLFTSDYSLSKFWAWDILDFRFITLISGLALTIDMSIPITDIGTEILITVPFSVTFPTSSTVVTGRSLSTGLESPRASMYAYVEKYMSQITGADGHACLLRAMCEASATPLHDEGLLGDAVNFLLTANYATEETDEKFKKYFAAQAQGQVKWIY